MLHIACYLVICWLHADLQELGFLVILQIPMWSTYDKFGNSLVRPVLTTFPIQEAVRSCPLLKIRLLDFQCQILQTFRHWKGSHFTLLEYVVD